jgi:hypothetical protein
MTRLVELLQFESCAWRPKARFHLTADASVAFDNPPIGKLTSTSAIDYAPPSFLRRDPDLPSALTRSGYRPLIDVT